MLVARKSVWVDSNPPRQVGLLDFRPFTGLPRTGANGALKFFKGQGSRHSPV